MATPSPPDYVARAKRNERYRWNAGHRSAGLKQGQQLAVPSEAEGITMALKEGRAQSATPLLALTRGGGGATAKYCG